MKRKLLALLLALVMVLSLLPAALVPDTAVADGNNEDLAQATVQGGAILHCFNWSYKAIIDNLDDIAAAGYTAVQTSPVQPPKDYNAAWDNTKGGWWKFYQPLDFRIAGEGETWLCEGGKTLADLCTEAHKKGIKVIVDVVANHTANKAGGGVLKDGEYNVSEQVAERLQDPDNSKKIYHWNENNIGNSRYEMTQYQMDLPDLNTGNPVVQEMVLDFLKDCADCGVDGFRFDAAKHIELPKSIDGNDTGSDFWPYVINGINSHKSGLYLYGEILYSAGTDIGNYTQYMAVTDKTTGDNVRDAVVNLNAGTLAVGTYAIGSTPEKSVLWAESHDTYEDGASAGYSNENIVKSWAIVGARANSTSLYLARPNNVLGKASSDTTWKSTAVAEVNKFKNHFDGTGEWLGYNQDNQYAYILRGNDGSAGIVIDNLKGAGEIEITLPTDENAPQMAPDTYKDEVSGNIFTVADGKIKGYVNTTGVAVVYKRTTDSPRTITASTLYLRPGDDGEWNKDGAHIAVYLFNAVGDYAWVEMESVGDNFYSAAVPTDHEWTSVIFCRLGAAVTDDNQTNWNNKWNQTSDLIPDDGKNCYVFALDDNWNTTYATWSNYGDGGYFVVGTMNSWSLDPAFKMTKVDGTNEYTVETELMTNSEFKVVKSWDGITPAAWYPAEGDNYGHKADGQPDVITADGIYKIRFCPDGNVEGWHYGYITVEQTKYAVKVDNRGAQGTVAVSKERAAADEPITLTITPNEGYVLDTVTVTTARGRTVEVNNNTFTMPAENVTVKATFKALPKFESCSVVLSGQIGMNFYMTIPEEYIDTNTNPEVTFTIAADEKSRTTTAIGKKLDDGRYRFTCYLTSVEMTDQITAVYNYEVDGEPMTASMETSIQGYLNKIIENKENDPEFERAKDLAKALWTYGYYAHDAVTDGPNHKQMDIGNVNMINDPSIVGFDLTVIKGSEVAKITYSLSLDSETALNIYLTPAGDAAFTKDNVIVRIETEIYENYIVEKVGARYRVKITGIGAHELGTGFNVDVGTRANTTISNVSVVSIVKKYLANDTIKTETKNAATALYYYYQAAIAYKEG
ncbi:MAG: hypothetical protein IJK88_01325 [Clostridia bacterium]|nr:hypothetical protein [Clostridia bacterium]